MKNSDGFIKNLGELIAIESVEGEADQGAPFGKNVKRALTWFLNLAESFGFKP